MPSCRYLNFAMVNATGGKIGVAFTFTFKVAKYFFVFCNSAIAI
jgi:hypothetical protein